MCGIIAVTGASNAADQVLEGLARLEYRGYDSAGIATIAHGKIERARAEGKLKNLAAKLATAPLPGTIGIGHTRWATHGGPTENNAHPHATDKVAVVHNGIIENYQALRAELEQEQRRFDSDTDTEVIAHLLTHYLDNGLSQRDAVYQTLQRLHGAFSLAIIFAGNEHEIYGARRGTPLAIGYSDNNMYLASDAIALANFTNRICYLTDGDWTVLTPSGAQIFDMIGNTVERPVRISTVSAAMTGKGEFRHYMLKEIHEQPEVLSDTINTYTHPATGAVQIPPLPFDFKTLPRLTISACGTGYLAGLVAKYWFEQIARLPVELDIASEFRYRAAPLPDGGAFLAISQSGETLDTLEALRFAAKETQHIIAICNVIESTIARESDVVLYTQAGPEISVASTKGFVTQLATLAALTIFAAEQRGAIDATEARRLTAVLREVPALIAEVLRHEADVQAIAAQLAGAQDILYMGRGTSYAIALEGALKLKELSYIHAEGYAAGELKHGPIALIDDNVPVIVVAPPDALFEKTAGNIQEVAARGGQVLLLSSASGATRVGSAPRWSLTLPETDSFIAPLIYTVPIQLLAYHIAVLKGTDVDQPRNLAKSVTVE